MDASVDQSRQETGDDFKSFGQNSSATRTTTTTSTSTARLLQPLTSTTTKTEGPSSSFKETSNSLSSDRRTDDSMGSNDATPSSTNGNDMKKILTTEDLTSLSREELIFHTKQLQDRIVDLQEEKTKEVLAKDKLKEQLLEATRRENLLILKMATKEKEVMEVNSQLKDMKRGMAAVTGSSELKLEKALIDPAINLVFEKMKQEVADAKSRVEEMQGELSAWKFTPDSNMGKRLMAKCRQLYQENEELGKMISSGKIAKIEGELALQKNFAEEIKKSQSEIDDFLVELDDDFEGMQNTICTLQQNLKEAKDQLLSFQTNMFKPNGVLSAEVNGVHESLPQEIVVSDTVPQPPALTMDILESSTVSSLNESTAATIDEEESMSRKRVSEELEQLMQQPVEKRERIEEEEGNDDNRVVTPIFE